jgi:hypothetical protein
MGSWADLGLPLAVLFMLAIGLLSAIGLILWRRR